MFVVTTNTEPSEAMAGAEEMEPPVVYCHITAPVRPLS